jgi:hypothetical protein
MDIDIKQQVKEILLKENIGMTDVVNKLNGNRPDSEKTTVASLNNKLTRGTIRYSEILEIFDVLNYDIILHKRDIADVQSSKGFKPMMAGAVTGLATGGIIGSIVGGALGLSWGKAGTITGGKEKNIITGDDALKIAESYEKEYGYNPIPTDDELYQINLELEQDRLDLEHDVEVNIQAILNSIVLDCEVSIRKKYKDLIDSYILIKDLPVSFKLTSMYRVIFKLLSIQSDAGLRTFISDLRNLYVHGGLMHIFEVSRYYRDLLKEND